MSFPPGTEMFHFPEFTTHNYIFIIRFVALLQRRLPHSGIPGSKLACSSPGLIAAGYALRRLLSPRHPPCALSSLIRNPTKIASPDHKTITHFFHEKFDFKLLFNCNIAKI